MKNKLLISAFISLYLLSMSAIGSPRIDKDAASFINDVRIAIAADRPTRQGMTNE